MRPIAYYADGKPIPDIRAWAKDRGEQMVRVRREWDELMPFASQIVHREETQEMPASFFASMRFGGMFDETYTELERFDP